MCLLRVNVLFGKKKYMEGIGNHKKITHTFMGKNSQQCALKNRECQRPTSFEFRKTGNGKHFFSSKKRTTYQEINRKVWQQYRNKPSSRKEIRGWLKKRTVGIISRIHETPKSKKKMEVIKTYDPHYFLLFLLYMAVCMCDFVSVCMCNSFFL